MIKGTWIKQGAHIMESIIKGMQAGISTDHVIDKTRLKKIQDYFCTVGNLYAFCVDQEGCMLTEMSGSEAEVRRLFDSFGQDAFFRVCERVMADPLEDQIVEDTCYDNVKIAAININIEKKPILTWGICAVLKMEEGDNLLDGMSRQIEEKNLYHIMDLIRILTQSILEARVRAMDTEIRNQKNITDKESLGLALKRAEALTQIVQLLDRDDPVEVVFTDILRIAGEYLDIGSAQIFKLNRDGETMDVVAEWCHQGLVSVFEKTRNIVRSPLLKGNTVSVVSYDTECPSQEREWMEKAHIMARATFPMFVNGQVSMYASFHECKKKKHWSEEEIRFLHDTVQVIQSILTKRIQKNSLVSSYATLEALLDHVGCAVYVRDQATGMTLFVNRVLKATFEKELMEGRLEEIFVNPGMVGEEEHREIFRKEKARYYELYTTVITWMDGRKALLYSAYDITEKKLYQKKIEQQAYTDYLTGLYNRMCCERDLAIQIDYAKKHHQKGAILYLDLDDFKHINDGLGHQYGDVLLQAIAHSIQRIEDIQDTCYRMGGDEFVIIIPVELYPRLERIVEAIKLIFSKPWFLKDADYYCTMSMGIAEFPDESDNVQDLIKKADIAMYEAKHGGKNRIARYTDKINSDSGRRLDMEKNMRDATNQGYHGFEVYHQPILDIQEEGKPCTGPEALVRWNSAELGFISPSEFIPLAEYLGLINPIGNFVLREACKTLREWNDNGYPNYKINVNLSVVQLLQSDVVESIETVIHESGINAGNLTLEVTESLAINDMEKMKNILGRIKALGVRIALDDFGTGYSSLNHIREMPLDVIKVDQTFVKDLDKDTYSQAFIKMVAELAQSIGVYVCVEGIERKEQMQVLEGMKVRLIQGYYFGRPMNRTSFDEKFAPLLQQKAENEGNLSGLNTQKKHERQKNAAAKRSGKV